MNKIDLIDKVIAVVNFVVVVNLFVTIQWAFMGLLQQKFANPLDDFFGFYVSCVAFFFCAVVDFSLIKARLDSAARSIEWQIRIGSW